MSNLVEALRDYMDVPSDPVGLFRAFTTGRRKTTLEREMIESGGWTKVTAPRQLERWGIVEKSRGGRQRRAPERMQKTTRAKLRRILLSRLVPARITVKGDRIGYSEKDKRPRTITVDPLTLDDLQELLRFAAAVERSSTWPVSAETAATFVFTGWYFEDVEEEIDVDGVTFTLPYDDTLDYEDAVFTVSKSSRGRGTRAA